MTSLVPSALLLLLLAPAASVETGAIDRTAVAQLSIHQRIVIRIPRLPRGYFGYALPERPIRWVERKGPKCVAVEALEGAVITTDDSVDLMLDDGTRLRAELENHCPALDFYSGLYIKRTADAMVCAERDSIRARSGGECRIDRYKRLVARQ